MGETLSRFAPLIPGVLLGLFVVTLSLSKATPAALRRNLPSLWGGAIALLLYGTLPFVGGRVSTLVVMLAAGVVFCGGILWERVATGEFSKGGLGLHPAAGLLVLVLPLTLVSDSRVVILGFGLLGAIAAITLLRELVRGIAESNDERRSNTPTILVTLMLVMLLGLYVFKVYAVFS